MQDLQSVTHKSAWELYTQYGTFLSSSRLISKFLNFGNIAALKGMCHEEYPCSYVLSGLMDIIEGDSARDGIPTPDQPGEQLPFW